MLLEVCVDSFKSLQEAKRAGANRIELCSALNIGGLTPSYGLLNQVKSLINECYEVDNSSDKLEVFVMIRPRSGDFLYNEDEFETMLQDIDMVKELGFDGIVTGALLQDGQIDLDRMKSFVERAKPLRTVLHRAFDHACEPDEKIPALIEIGICRILTSGQRENALEGAQYLKVLQDKYGKWITIMPGCGINQDNIQEIMNITGCKEYHMSGKKNIGSHMVYRESLHRMKLDNVEFVVEETDFQKVHSVRQLLDEASSSLTK